MTTGFDSIIYTEDITLHFLETSTSFGQLTKTSQSGSGNDGSNDLFPTYGSIPLWNDVALGSLVLLVGLILNSIILRLYFKVKTDLALYMKVLAGFDVLTLCYSTLCRGLALSFPKRVYMLYKFYGGLDVIVAHAMLGPLFLALDRFLVVVFPHKFQLYEKKMRIFKVVLVLFASSSAIGWLFNDWNLVLMMLCINLLIHFVGCIVLYTVIVVRVCMSAREMEAHRHTGNNRLENYFNLLPLVPVYQKTNFIASICKS